MNIGGSSEDKKKIMRFKQIISGIEQFDWNVTLT